MDRKQRAVIVDDVNHPNEPPTLATTDNQVFVVPNMPWIPAAGIPR